VVVDPDPPPVLVPGPPPAVPVVDVLVAREPADPVVRLPPSPPSGGPPRSLVVSLQAAATRRRNTDPATVKDFMATLSLSELGNGGKPDFRSRFLMIGAVRTSQSSA